MFVYKTFGLFEIKNVNNTNILIYRTVYPQKSRLIYKYKLIVVASVEIFYIIIIIIIYYYINITYNKININIIFNKYYILLVVLSNLAFSFTLTNEIPKYYLKT